MQSHLLDSLQGHRVAFFLFIVLLLGFPLSCSDSGSSDDGELSGSDVRETLLKTTLQTQHLLRLQFACLSDGYEKGVMETQITQDEENRQFWFDCYDSITKTLLELQDLEEDFKTSLVRLEILEAPDSELRKKGIISSFFGLFSKTGDLFEGQRKDFLTIADSLTDEERTALYDTAKNATPTAIKRESSNEEEFYDAMREGKLDDAISKIHGTILISTDDDLSGYQAKAQEKEIRPIDTVAKKVPGIASEGVKLLVGTGQTAFSGVSVLREGMGIISTAKERMTSSEATMDEATAEGKELPAYMQDKLVNSIGIEAESTEVGDISEALTLALLDTYVQDAITEDAEKYLPDILEFGYSQISIESDEDHMKEMEKDSEDNLVVATSTDLFTAGRMIIASGDTENNPMVVLPGTYDVTVTVKEEKAIVEDVTVTAGEVATIKFEPSFWKPMIPISSDDDDDDSSSTDEMPDSASACAHFESAYGSDGSCYTNIDFFTYCAESGPYYCSCIPFEGSGPGEWTVFGCEDLCQGAGLGRATDCDGSSERKTELNELYDLMQETAGPFTTIMEQCVCQDEWIPEAGEECQWASPNGTNLYAQCEEVLEREKDRWMDFGDVVCVNGIQYSCSGELGKNNVWSSKSSKTCNDNVPSTFDGCQVDCTVGYGCDNFSVEGVGKFHENCSESQSGEQGCIDTGDVIGVNNIPVTVRTECMKDTEDEKYKIKWVVAERCETTESEEK